MNIDVKAGYVGIGYLTYSSKRNLLFSSSSLLRQASLMGGTSLQDSAKVFKIGNEGSERMGSSGSSWYFSEPFEVKKGLSKCSKLSSSLLSRA